ncbi:hypothetical protein ACFFQF_01030 [Haladaptatus pallidirubidus]|uniref:DksA C4-type domain-containing protein n=1 Tax=Haladaptatus pallidirubidus TaxID=1008152 RepID=A0AAV3UC93_9EURY|nr:hypothetical protein [Haladaptatus pallidirubidus]
MTVQDTQPIRQRGIYLMADTPLSAMPLALEDGNGDKNLLADVLGDELTGEELDDLISKLKRRRAEDSEDGTSIVCGFCGHVRPTTEKFPTLVSCEACGSSNVRYDNDRR